MTPKCDPPAKVGTYDEKHHCTFDGGSGYSAFSYYFPRQASKGLMIGFDSGSHPTVFQLLLADGTKRWFHIGADAHCDLVLANLNVGEIRYW